MKLYTDKKRYFVVLPTIGICIEKYRFSTITYVFMNWFKGSFIISWELNRKKEREFKNCTPIH